MHYKCLIICPDKITNIDKNLSKLLDFYGIIYQYFPINRLKDLENLSQLLCNKKNILLFNCKSIDLDLLYDKNKKIEDFFKFIKTKFSHVLVYNISPNAKNILILSNLSNGKIKSISKFFNSKHRYIVSKFHRDVCKHFSGLEFGPINNETDFKFEIEDNNKKLEELIYIDRSPFFIKIVEAYSTLFFIASNNILNINKSIFEFNVKNFFSQIVPYMMFIKHVFNEYCWHNYNNRACLIIDDPLLKENYGFLNYRKLLSHIEKYNFSTAIAFIPWNYKRTNLKLAKFLKSKSQNFSICIHGCDHTKNEFGALDINELYNKVNLAIKRMKIHEKTTGLKFNKIMIFPQGIFSKNAMITLKANNFMAAINSEATAIDEKNPLKICDFLEPAILNYSSFPLFIRKYPLEILDFAFDLFLGKPGLIAIHHNDLKDNHQSLLKFIKDINSLYENIEWTNLEKICESSYLQRRENKNSIYIKLFCRNVVIENCSNYNIKYIIKKYENGEVPINNLKIDGKETQYLIEEERNDNKYLKNKKVKLSINIHPHGKIRLEINYKKKYQSQMRKNNIFYNIRVIIRRFLSEFRDNYISKNNLLYALYCKFRKC
ncbi:MAG: hypothetical protein ACTSQS_16785 [Promethearchaeota archaeon]